MFRLIFSGNMDFDRPQGTTLECSQRILAKIVQIIGSFAQDL